MYFISINYKVCVGRYTTRISKYGGDMIERKKKQNKNNNEAIDELSAQNYN